jgi:CP family cyanate transporter-like MFS transporter
VIAPVPPRRLLLVGFAAIALVGLNLRLTLAILSPLLPQVQSDYQIGSAPAGLATTAAVLMFGLAAPVAPLLVTRFHSDRVLLGGLMLVVAGTGLRSLPVITALYGGMVLLGIGIALLNVVMPVIVKRDFPRAVGLCTGLYTSALNVGSALAAATAVPLAQAVGGWRPTAALAAVPAVLAMLVWWARMPRRSATAHPVTARGRLLRSPLAWQVTGYMALQSVLYYVLLAWLPTIYADNGFSAEHAGLVLAVAQIAQLAACILVPVLARALRDQRLLAAGFAALTGAAYLGIGVAPTLAPVLWAVLLGLGQGGALTVALMMIVVRSPDTASAARLSGMAQGVGYVLAAAGPPLVGALHDGLGGWTLALIMVTGLCGVELVVGLLAGRDRVIGPLEAPVRTGTVVRVAR